MNPHIINCLQRGYEEKVKREDYLQYLWWGKYGVSAFMFAIDHCFAKSPRSEFEKEPILSQIRANRPLTEEEKEKELREFIKQNERMRSKWKRKQNKKKERENEQK